MTNLNDLTKTSQQVLTIFSAAQAILAVIKAAKPLYETALRAMDTIEVMKNNSVAQKGSDKKAWVLAYVESIANDLNINWDTYVDSISKFIDESKQLYNQLLKVKEELKI